VATGYCFVLQAGSIANDACGAFYSTAAIDFALRARKSRRVGDVWFSLLAVGVMTGCKVSNLPLLLCWSVAVWPVISLLWINRPRALVIVALAGLASFLPTAILNIHCCGDWD